MNLEKTITNLLATTIDPMLQMTVRDMGIKTDITVECSRLNLTLHAGFPIKPLENYLLPALATAFQQTLPKYQTNITLEQAIKTHRTQLVGKSLRGVKNTIAIASGKGGVGKSTVAVNLAVALARAGARVGLLDADIYGPSIPLMLGESPKPVVRDDRYEPVLAHGVQAMSIGYMAAAETALIWRGPMLAKSMIQLLDATLWDNLDCLFIDLPPGTGDIQLSLVQKIPLTAAVIVTTPQQIATLDAQKALNMFEKTSIDTLGIIENMSQHRCEHCGHETATFGQGGAEQLCTQHQCVLLGQLPLDQKIGQDSDQGTPTAANQSQLAHLFTKIALKASVELSKRPLDYMDRYAPIAIT